jgi:protein TonB
MVGSLIWFEGQKVEVGNPFVIYFVLVGGVIASFAVGFFSRKAGAIASAVCVVLMPVLLGWLLSVMGHGLVGDARFGVAIGLLGAIVGVIGLPRDLLISTFASLVAVGALLTLFNGRDTTVKKQEEPPPVLEILEMPVIPPDEPDPTEVHEATEAQPTYTPMLADVPSAVSLQDFVQPMQPPPPPNNPALAGVIEIPPTRTNIGTGLGAIFNLGDLDQIPQPTFQPPPQYPYEMKRAGINGTVTVGFIVDTTGAVRDAYVVSSSHSEFEAAALAAITKWRFRPGRRKGAPVNTRMQQPLSFKLTDSR